MKNRQDWDPIRERFFKGMHDALEAVGISNYSWPEPETPAAESSLDSAQGFSHHSGWPEPEGPWPEP